jgi:hypothetical protein
VCATGSKCLQAFILAGDPLLSQEVADSKIRDHSDCASNILSK